jgi:hypothetical protein
MRIRRSYDSYRNPEQNPDQNSFAARAGGFAGLDQSFQYQSKL